MRHLARMRAWARDIRAELGALAVAVRRPDVPWHAKLVAVLVVAYAVSPIDLIPDVVPVLGLLDDAVLVPLGILLARRLVPPAVLEACRVESDRRRLRRSRGMRAAGVTLVFVGWLTLAAVGWWLWRELRE